ncbi:protein FAM126B isoform X2 [Daktulosphaira vitifoliae]|uniref:protein FAM126B isoform X2 n=1 Tax=Daktulosphaira vitifoliae TaxID=58002 RepID=UPI0021AA2988|nr:protein FAM126B isoform X2 [Daktulosphaira vitifoliae]
MVEIEIKDWLSEIATLEKDDWATFAVSTTQNKILIESIYAVLDEIKKYSKLVDRICGALFNCYKTEETDLHLFVLLFLPHLTYNYLNSLTHVDKLSCRSIEALLIGIYNLEIVDENNTPRVISFRLPSLAQPSIYHEPSSLAPTSLTETAIRRLEQRDTHPVRRGPFNQIEKLSASNRMEVLSHLYFIYYKNINLLPEVYSPFDRFYKITIKMLTQGFHQIHSTSFDSADILPSADSRIHLSPKFLIHLLYCLYISIFNCAKAEAIQALDNVYYRACYHCYCEVILLANAIKNSCEGYFDGGQSLNVSSVGTPVNNSSCSTPVSKSMITNASFRTKKLPDDIPIQNSHGTVNESFDAGSNLTSIVEETDGKDLIVDSVPIKRSLPKIAANFGKKTAEKIAIAVKSSSNTKVSKLCSQNGSDIYETDESGIDLTGSDISDSKAGVGHEEKGTLTPLLSKRNPSIDIETARSIQIESTAF